MDEKVKKWVIKVMEDYKTEFKKLDVGNLSYYAVEVRYADEFYIPTLEEAKRAFEIAKKAKEFIFRKMEIREDELKWVLNSKRHFHIV